MSRTFSASELIRQALQLGVAIVVPLLVLLGAGHWLDVRYNTTPLFLVGGLVVSFILSIITLVQIVRRANTHG
ncbi:MAG: AtpZ/AtpI family protein [bacterium]|nr:AtpZ/AtpI family protein [bacterium]